jgi:hypothetical protein
MEGREIWKADMIETIARMLSEMERGKTGADFFNTHAI